MLKLSIALCRSSRTVSVSELVALSIRRQAKARKEAAHAATGDDRRGVGQRESLLSRQVARVRAGVTPAPGRQVIGVCLHRRERCTVDASTVYDEDDGR